MFLARFQEFEMSILTSILLSFSFACESFQLFSLHTLPCLVSSERNFKRASSCTSLLHDEEGRQQAWHILHELFCAILFNYYTRFHREDILATLLSQLESGGPAASGGVKCVPSYVAPDLASAIRRSGSDSLWNPHDFTGRATLFPFPFFRHISQSLRQRKGHFPCYYVAEWATYTLPPGRSMVVYVHWRVLSKVV